MWDNLEKFYMRLVAVDSTGSIYDSSLLPVARVNMCVLDSVLLQPRSSSGQAVIYEEEEVL